MATKEDTNMDNNPLIAELKRCERENKHSLRHLLRLSFLVGLDFTSWAVYRDYMKILNAIVFGIGFIGAFGQFGFIWHNRNAKFTVFSEAICVVLQCISGLIELVVLLLMQQNLESILKAVQSGEILKTVDIFDWDLKIKGRIFSETCDIVAASWRNIRIQVGFLLSSVTLVITWYCVGPLVVNAYRLQTHRGKNVTLELPLPTMFIIYEPAWIVKYSISFIETYIAGLVAATFDAIFLVGTVHATALIKVLRLLISNVANVPTEKRLDYLCCCSRFYQRIYSFFLDIDKIYCNPTFVKYCFTLVINVMILFQASLGLEEDMKMFFKMAFDFCAVCCAITVFLFNGQKLTTECESLPLTWYECEWYNESPEFKNIVEMMIMRTNKGMQYNLAGFFKMSLVSLMFVIRSSGSYFLILKNFHSSK